jgi:N-acetylglucosamine kinase-like BadF-type ATPase
MSTPDQMFATHARAKLCVRHGSTTGDNSVPDLTSGLRVGIDVGGTKTHLRAVRGAELVADRVCSSEGWQPADFAAAAAFLADLVRDTVPETDLTDLAAVAVGAHGCDSAQDCLGVRSELVRLLPAPCVVRNDAELLVPAMGLDSGAGLVSGTGSIAVGRSRTGEAVYVGGWGWLFGDEGSAPGLLREAARAALAARDRGEPPDLLTEKLLDSFAVSEVTDLPEAMVAAGGARDWGLRAELVFEALAGGSALAESVVEDAAAALAGLVVRLAARDVPVDDVVVAGGVILNQPSLFEAFAARLELALPDTVPHRLDVAPVLGAVRLAQLI